MSDIIYASYPILADWLVWEVDSRFCRDDFTFKNDTGATATFESGRTLVISGDYLVPANGNTCDAILIDRVVSLANNGTQAVAALYRGPALVNVDGVDFSSGATDPDADPQRTAQIADLDSISIKALESAAPSDSM